MPEFYEYPGDESIKCQQLLKKITHRGPDHRTSLKLAWLEKFPDTIQDKEKLTVCIDVLSDHIYIKFLNYVFNWGSLYCIFYFRFITNLTGGFYLEYFCRSSSSMAYTL